MALTFKSILNFYQNTRPIYRFIFKGVALISVWLIFYKLFRNVEFINSLYESGIALVLDGLTHTTHFALELFGYKSTIYFNKVTGFSDILKIDQAAEGVWIGRGCIGRNLMGLFAGFLIIYPGNYRTKLWYIPLGLFFIFFLNVLRIGGLALILLYNPNLMDTSFDNHHDIFNYTVYAIIFIMWYIWITRLSKVKTEKAETTQ